MQSHDSKREFIVASEDGRVGFLVQVRGTKLFCFPSFLLSFLILVSLERFPSPSMSFWHLLLLKEIVMLCHFKL